MMMIIVKMNESHELLTFSIISFIKQKKFFFKNYYIKILKIQKQMIIFKAYSGTTIKDFLVKKIIRFKIFFVYTVNCSLFEHKTLISNNIYNA